MPKQLLKKPTFSGSSIDYLLKEIFKIPNVDVNVIHPSAKWLAVSKVNDIKQYYITVRCIHMERLVQNFDLSQTVAVTNQYHIRVVNEISTTRTIHETTSSCVLGTRLFFGSVCVSRRFALIQ